MKDLTGKEIRGYILRECIGSGGYGAIYRAEQPLVGREVAIKVILPDHAQQPEFRASFEAEARMVGGLVNPNVVPLYDFWESEAGAFLVMPFLRGGNLRQLIDDGPLDLQVAAKIVDQITDALHAAHQKKIVHRDIKPENILLDESGNAYLADFSIAKDLGHKGITKPWEFEGTVAYMAPEQLTGDDITFQTDIYTLGLVIYEMLTGAHPFPELNLMQLTRNPPYEFLPPLQDCGPNLPGELDGVIQQATDKDDSHRYPDVVKLRTAFHRALGIERGEAPAPATLEAQYPSFLEEGETLFIRPFFVGREAELARMEDFLDQAPSGKDQVAFITGGAGTGKTALLNEFTLRAQEADESLIVASGSCSAHIGPGDPYLPFRDILRMLTGEVETQWAAGAISKDHAQRLWHLLPEAIQALMDAGPDLLDVFVTGRGLLSRGRIAQPMGSPALEQLKSWTAFKKEKSEGNEPISLQEQYLSVLLSLANSHPLLLLIDDLQWADAASINMLHHLGRRISGSPIFILCAYRADEVAFGRDEGRHPLKKALMEFKRRFGDVWIDLDAVDEAEGRRFIQDYLQPEHYQLDDAFKEELYQHTNGHPLFTVELLRAMQERGDLVKGKADRWERGPSLDWDQLPARVEGVIEERLGRLSPGQRDLLDLAAVEGEQFSAQVLATAQDTTKERSLEEVIGHLEGARSLILEDGIEIKLGRRLFRYRFRHALIQSFLYNHLSPIKRELLHAKIGNALECFYQQHLDEVAPRLVQHFKGAAEYEKVLRYAELAGKRAYKMAAAEDALQHFKLALETAGTLGLTSSQDQVRRLHEQMGDVYMVILSRLEEALEHYQLAGEDSASAEERVRSLRKQATALQLLGDLTKAGETFEKALMEAQGAEYSLEGSRIHAEMVYLNRALGRLEVALEHAQNSLALAQQSGDKRCLAVSYKVMSLVMAKRGDFSEAYTYDKKCLDLFKELGDLPRLTQTYNNIADSLRYLGRMKEAEEHLQRGLKLAREIIDIREEALLLQTLGELQLDQGFADEAIETLKEATRISERSGIPGLLIASHKTLGKAYQSAGNLIQSDQHLMIAEGLAKKMKQTGYLPDILLSRSRLLSDQGAYQEAQLCIDSAIDTAGKDVSDIFQYSVCNCKGYLHARVGSWEKSIENYRNSLKYTQRMGFPHLEGEAHLQLGTIYLRRGKEGDIDRASEHLVIAEKLFRRIGAEGYHENTLSKLKDMGSPALI